VYLVNENLPTIDYDDYDRFIATMPSLRESGVNYLVDLSAVFVMSAVLGGSFCNVTVRGVSLLLCPLCCVRCVVSVVFVMSVLEYRI
jgi:hypothetical protein